MASWLSDPLAALESTFDGSWIDWSLSSWYITFIFSAIYIMLIYPLRKWMEPQEPKKLRGPLVAWNLIIGMFSIIGTARVLPDFLKNLRNDGFYASFCESNYFLKDHVGIWGFLFILSKIPELIDTLFIILRKQKLIFLHWYHHASTLIFAWRMYATRSSVAYWFCTMNYFVHSLMYSYYAIRAAGFRVNRKIAMVITSLQLLQMFVGIYAVLYAVHQIANGHRCDTKTPELVFGVVIYTSYMILFSKFFYDAYIGSRRVRPSRDSVADGKKVAEVNANGSNHDVMNGKGDHLISNGNGHMRLRSTQTQQ
ncbi:very long chain fatty acid elongase 6-like [Lytechinus pictus]|uniref:very long chain fatty acid elongase 6-like n=1 Tax=Lytechinus pictus TaxID=7653 RepID=UPI0030BA0045